MYEIMWYLAQRFLWVQERQRPCWCSASADWGIKKDRAASEKWGYGVPEKIFTSKILSELLLKFTWCKTRLED